MTPLVFRVLLIGDTGEPDSVAPVATAAKAACDRLGGCDLGLLLGDNVYEHGAASDADFERAWKTPMAAWAGTTTRFWVVPGNHDWRAGPSGVSRQVAWASRPDASGWSMKAGNYVVPDTPTWLNLYAVDTMPVLRRKADLRPLLAEAERRDGWEVVLGHHFAWSSGQHGTWLWRFLEGHAPEKIDAAYQPFADAGARLWLAGHDHDQEIVTRDGVWQIVQGNSAKTRTVGRAVRGSTGCRGGTRGYTILTFTERTVTIQMYSLEAEPWQERVLERTSGGWLAEVSTPSPRVCVNTQ
jgi:hypothetical protein